MKFWPRKPDIGALEKQNDIPGLLAVLQEKDPQLQKVIEALIRIMRREGLTTWSRHNSGAAEALSRLGIWQPLLTFYDEYEPPAGEPEARGNFVLTLTRLLGDAATRTDDPALAKHLLMTAIFRFEELGWHWMTGGSALLKELVATLERAGAADDLAEVWAKAADSAARQLAGAALHRLGASKAVEDVVSKNFTFDQVLGDFLVRQKYQALIPSPLDDPALAACVRTGNDDALELLHQIADRGLQEALLKSGRGEMLKRYNERPSRGDDHLDRRIQKYVRRLLHESKHAVVPH